MLEQLPGRVGFAQAGKVGGVQIGHLVFWGCCKKIAILKMFRLEDHVINVDFEVL